MEQISNQYDFSHPENKVRKGSWLLFFFLLLVIFGLIIYYFAEIKNELKLLHQVSPIWLLAALFAQFLTYLFTAFIYQLLLTAQKLPSPGLGELFKASIISLFFNQTVPSAGISGNTFIFNFLVKYNIRIPQIILLILAELLIFYIAMEFIILFLLLFYLSFYNTHHLFTLTLIAGFIVYFVFAVLIVFTWKKRLLQSLLKRIQKVKFIKRFFERIYQQIQQKTISDSKVSFLALLKSSKKTLLKTLLFQWLVIGADSATLYLLFYGLGFHVPAFVVLLTLICTKIISILPFLPGALFLYESSMSIFFTSLGVSVSVAIIVTLIYRLLVFWFPMPIGLFLYRRWVKKNA